MKIDEEILIYILPHELLIRKRKETCKEAHFIPACSMDWLSRLCSSLHERRRSESSLPNGKKGKLKIHKIRDTWTKKINKEEESSQNARRNS
ncbi:hypothetical protein T4D_11369, partial [Trichinella pseudospiralis]